MAFMHSQLGLVAVGRITIWSYKTDDPLAEVVRSGYFVNDDVRPGDRIEVSVGNGDVQATLAVLARKADKIRVAIMAVHDQSEAGAGKKPA